MNRFLFASLCALLSVTAFSFSAHAIAIELGAQYGHKTQTYDTNNYNEMESMTGSMSFYLWERIALELSYTDAQSVVVSKAYASDPKRTTIQRSQILGSDLILILADKKALFQPYIKGGLAQINRKQTIKIENQDTYENEPDSAVAPSYGVGLKISLTETFGIKLSYDAWETPIGGGSKTNDSAIRAGVTWML
ncbi:outer membrane beta-barrel protein [Bdellovibrio sp. KM01]|uniref:outer membrane beta-barrel protein n=1 Tax=Bdellovibrio sp. KM01 TaxID=2748865 RepID=UPI0015E9B04A|nr:outer membrane beta-barrel protein [Bdellovibrio sp. KM01]QLY24836.1 outer membrane beta-barrel protein [Bdellovibrio sp. KM01]